MGEPVAEVLERLRGYANQTRLAVQAAPDDISAAMLANAELFEQAADLLERLSRVPEGLIVAAYIRGVEWARENGGLCDASIMPFAPKAARDYADFVLSAAPQPPTVVALTRERDQAREALENEKADLAALLSILYTDEAFIGTHWESFPDASAGAWPSLSAHINNYAADAEEIPRSEWQAVSKLIGEFGRGSVEAWACWRRGIDKPPKGSLTADGEKALAALKRARSVLHPEKEEKA